MNVHRLFHAFPESLGNYVSNKMAYLSLNINNDSSPVKKRTLLSRLVLDLYYFSSIGLNKFLLMLMNTVKKNRWYNKHTEKQTSS